MMRLLIMLVICGQAFAVDKMLAAVPKVGSHSKEQPKNDTVLPVESHQQVQPQLPENSKNQINNHNSQLGGHVKHQKTSHGSHVQQIPQNVQHPTFPIQASHSSHKPTVPHLQQHVEEVAQHAQHHIPQVLSHYVAQQEEITQHQHDVGKQETPNKMRASRAVHHHHVSHHRQKHRPHRPHHHHHHHNKKRSKRATVPSHVQQLVQQIHHHVPHVIGQSVQQHNQNQKTTDHADHMNLEPPRKCNYECTHLDLAVCATNGKCWTEFESLCQMSNWNCLNTQKAFRQVLDAECMDSAKPKCYPGDMLN